MRSRSVSAPSLPARVARSPLRASTGQHREVTRNTAIGHQRVGTLCAVSIPPPHRRRARTAVAAVLLAVAAACADDSPTVAVETPADEASTTSTTRLHLAPSAGALKVQVDGIGERADDLDDVMLVGDSVMVLVADDLGNEVDATLHVDGADCRRLDRTIVGPCGAVPPGTEVSGGVEAVSVATTSLTDLGIVPGAAVLILANNAAVDASDLDAAMAATGDIPRVWWVTTRVADHGYQDPNNGALFDLAARDPRAGVIDWYAASEGHPEWLADGVHPNDAGQAALAALIAEHLRCDCTP